MKKRNIKTSVLVSGIVIVALIIWVYASLWITGTGVERGYSNSEMQVAYWFFGICWLGLVLLSVRWATTVFPDTEDDEEVKAFMAEFGLTGDPKTDGEAATNDLRFLRQLVEDDKTGAEKEFLDRFRQYRLKGTKS